MKYKTNYMTLTPSEDGKWQTTPPNPAEHNEFLGCYLILGVGKKENSGLKLYGIYSISSKGIICPPLFSEKEFHIFYWSEPVNLQNFIWEHY